MNAFTKTMIGAALLGAFAAAAAQTKTPPALSQAATKSSDDFTALLKQTSGVGDSRIAVLKEPGTLEFLASPRGMMGFVAINQSLQKYPEKSQEALTLFADMLPKIDHLRGWDGYQSVYIVQAARKADPQLGERVRLEYIDLLQRSIDKNDFDSGIPDFRPAEYYAKSLAHMKGNAMRGELLNKPAPEINFLWSSDPSLKKLADLYPGKVVVLDFWATWCKPCIGLFPKVRELNAKYQGKPVVFVGVTSIQGYHIDAEKGKIDCKGDPQKEISLMPSLMKQLNVTWTVAIGDKDCFNPDFDIMGIPHMAILDKNGIVRYDGVEPEEVAAKIDSLLNETVAAKEKR